MSLVEVMDDLVGEPRSRDSLCHQSDVVNQPNAAIEDFEYLIDLHPPITVAVVEYGIGDHDPALRINQRKANFGRRPPWLRPQIALIATHIAAFFNPIASVVRYPIAAMVTVATVRVRFGKPLHTSCRITREPSVQML